MYGIVMHYMYIVLLKYIFTVVSVHVQLYTGTALKVWELSGSVVECLTQDRGAAGSGLTGVTVLWSLSKTHLS